MSVKRLVRLGFERVESAFDAAFPPEWNPLYQLGALGWFYYWIVAASGVYLFVFFDTGVTQAYASVERITHAQWFAGGIMRSLHRYASDALVVMMLLHLLREWALDRVHGPRWFSWVTGVPLLWFVFAAGVSGYWLVWDKLAQYVALATSEWLDALPLFGEPIARNFVDESTLSGRFFTLMVFIHIAVPLIMLFVMWVHIHRYAHPKVNPPRGLAVGTLLMLLVLSLVHPALSQGPADLEAVPAVVGLDWFYLPIYPLLDAYPGGVVWAIVAAATLVMFAVPWLTTRSRAPVAVVDLDNCNGCARCVADCPYEAVILAPRSDEAAYEHEAVVVPSRCVSCGICAGACPTSTPYRRRGELVPGIDLPELPIRELRERSLAACAELAGNDRVMVYACRQGPRVAADGAPVAVISLPCVAMLPPAFIDFMISRRHVDGVLLTGCRAGACYERLGQRWTEERLAGERDPYLRARVPRERVAVCWAGLDRAARVARELESFRSRLRGLSDSETAAEARAEAV